MPDRSVDPDTLAEALEDVDEIYSYLKGDYFDEKWGLGEKAERVKAILRAVLEAPTAEWCEVHRAPVRGGEFGPDEVCVAVLHDFHWPMGKSCKVGRVRLVAEG